MQSLCLAKFTLTCFPASLQAAMRVVAYCEAPSLSQADFKFCGAKNHTNICFGPDQSDDPCVDVCEKQALPALTLLLSMNRSY
jgi:hypothetical protein